MPRSAKPAGANVEKYMLRTEELRKATEHVGEKIMIRVGCPSRFNRPWVLFKVWAGRHVCARFCPISVAFVLYSSPRPPATPPPLVHLSSSPSVADACAKPTHSPN